MAPRVLPSDREWLYVKSVRIRSFPGLYFPAFGLNTARYFLSFLIQSECGKMRTRKTPNTDLNTDPALKTSLRGHYNIFAVTLWVFWIYVFSDLLKKEVNWIDESLTDSIDVQNIAAKHYCLVMNKLLLVVKP